MCVADVAVDEVIEELRRFILARYLTGEQESMLTLETPLITGGILDSLSTLEAVAFLEKRLGLEFEAHEVNRDRLDTLAGIAEIVRDRLARTP